MLMRRPLLCRSRAGYPLSFHSSGSEAVPPILQRSLASSEIPPLLRERLCVPSLSVPPAFGFLPQPRPGLLVQAARVAARQRLSRP